MEQVSVPTWSKRLEVLSNSEMLELRAPRHSPVPCNPGGMEYTSHVIIKITRENPSRRHHVGYQHTRSQKVQLSPFLPPNTGTAFLSSGIHDKTLARVSGPCFKHGIQTQTRDMLILQKAGSGASASYHTTHSGAGPK